MEKSRRDLLTNISHDLQTPITSIQGYLEALLDNVITESVERTQHLRLIHTRVLGLNRLIQDLFQLTRLEISANYQEAQIKIKDNGSGISDEDLPYVFDRFYKTTNSRRSTSNSSGLGLAITKEIIETHEGHIWVESEANQGSTFYFTLPITPGTFSVNN